MRKSILIVLSLVLSGTIFAQNNLVNIKDAAKQQLNYFLNLIPQGQEAEYGFNNRQEFTKVTIGEPFQTYFVQKDGEAIILLPTALFRVPLLVDGKSVALLTVSNSNNQTKVVDFGAIKLAEKLQAFEKLQKENLQDRIIVRNTYLSRDFLISNLNNITSRNGDGKLVLSASTSALLYPIQQGKFKALNTAEFKLETLTTPLK